MTKRHDNILDAVLSGVPSASERKERQGGARFLKRGNAISSRLAGENEEKVLYWVDPAACRMWERHNRDYDLLTEENCRDLIDGIRSQGQQEFPAIVRRVTGDHDFEVICGARRHFAVSWLRANNYPNFRYLVEVRDLTDEEAFRLADVENRERADLSDYERARDYAEAIDLYYGGKQRAMAGRLEVTEVWLSRYLELARLPSEVVEAFASIHDLRELHARTLKPLLKDEKLKKLVLAAARDLAERQSVARKGQGVFVDAVRVISILKSAAAEPATALERQKYQVGSASVTFSATSSKHRLEWKPGVDPADLRATLEAFLADQG